MLVVDLITSFGRGSVPGCLTCLLSVSDDKRGMGAFLYSLLYGLRAVKGYDASKVVLGKKLWGVVALVPLLGLRSDVKRVMAVSWFLTSCIDSVFMVQDFRSRPSLGVARALGLITPLFLTLLMTFNKRMLDESKISQSTYEGITKLSDALSFGIGSTVALWLIRSVSDYKFRNYKKA